MKYGQVSVIFVSNFICSPTLKFRSEISSSSLGVCLAFELSVYLHFTHMLNFYAPAGSSSCLVCHAGDDGTMISSPWLFILCFFSGIGMTGALCLLEIICQLETF
jgi:hypothetical protein